MRPEPITAIPTCVALFIPPRSPSPYPPRPLRSPDSGRGDFFATSSPITHHVTHHPSPITSLVTRHPSPITHHPSPVTSLVIPHPSLLCGQSSPALFVHVPWPPSSA